MLNSIASGRDRHWRRALRFAGAVCIALAATAVVAVPASEAKTYDHDGKSSGKRTAKTEKQASKHKSSRRHTKSASSDEPKRRQRQRQASRSYSGGNVHYIASPSCLPGSLRSVVSEVSRFGSVTVNSTGRNRSHNAAVGGAEHSWHLQCRAVDFRVHGNYAAAANYLRNSGSVGGFHHYGGGLFHIDNGPKRTW